MGILAIIGLIILAGIILAFIGAAFIGSALPLAGLFSAILSIIANWWMVWLPILIIGIIAYIARGGTSRGSSEGVAAAIGATGGAAASEIMDRMEENDNRDNNAITDGNGFNTDPPHDSPTETSTSTPRNNPPSTRTPPGESNTSQSRTNNPRDTSTNQSNPTTKSPPRSPGHNPPSSRPTDSSPTGGDNNLNTNTIKDNMASNTEIGSLEHELETVVNAIGEEERRDKDELSELEQAKQELTTALRELQKHEQMEEFIIAINKEGITNKSSANEKAQVVQKYAQKYLNSSPDLQDIQNELQHLAKIEKLIQDAEKHMEKVEKEEQADLKETKQVEQNLAQTFANLDHLLDASKELQHYYGH